MEKENHILIGLGGTGGKILREFRKCIFEKYGKNPVIPNVGIEYLYVDSSEEDLNDKSKWKIMGGSVHLMEAQKVSIHGIGANVLKNLHQYPGIQCFINDEDKVLLNDINGLITDGIGGQRRRLGRLLFANNLCGEPDKNFTTRLKFIVDNLTKNTDYQVTFHICAGLAGGTGSGSIIDAIAQIRKEFAPQHGIGDGYKLNLYLYVPENIIANPRMNQGFYQPNGYAALIELNALSVGDYKPYDASGAKDEKGQIKRLLQNCDAFESAYLFSNINEAGQRLELERMLPSAVSNFLFQKIIVSNFKGGQMKRLQNCENAGTDPEKDNAGKSVHSRRFLSFGIKRVEYPENEIKEFVTYSFAQQAARQFQYNLWNDGMGFEECAMEEVGAGIPSELKEKKTIEDLLLSDNFLTLSKPVIEHSATRRWKDIELWWNEKAQFIADAIKEDVNNKKLWVSRFNDECTLLFERDYREYGVKAFYKIQREEKIAYAAYIRRHIEKKLFAEWQSGQKSIFEIRKFIACLISNCENRLPEFKDKIINFEEEIKGCSEFIKETSGKWSNLTFLDSIVNKREKLFFEYQSAMSDSYTYQTLIEGYKYADELMQAVINELTVLQNIINDFSEKITLILATVKDKIDSRCKGNDDNELVKKKYDPEKVKQATKRFICDEQQQKHNAAQIRGELIKLLGEDSQNFNNLLGRCTDLGFLEDIFIDTCLKNASAMMDDLQKIDNTLKMINVNILEKIKQEYNTDTLLEGFIEDVLKSATSYLQFNKEEVSKVLSGSKNEMQRMVQLCLPEFNDSSNFRDKFIKMFQQKCPGFNPDMDLSVNEQPNQIVVVAAASGFPLRFVANVANLREKYAEKLIGSDAALNKMLLHTESFTKKLPALFEQSTDEKKQNLIPTCILAFAMNLPVDKTDPVSGEVFKAIGIEDELGMVGNWINLGKNVMQAVEKLSINDSDADKVTSIVENKLNTDYLHNAKKAELKKAISELLQNHILPLCGNNDLDAQYKNYKELAVKTVQTTLKEK